MAQFGKTKGDKFLLLVVSFFGTGLLSKKMPGTIGSAFAAIVALLIYHFCLNHCAIFLVLSILTFVFGTYVCHDLIVKRAVEPDKDPKYVVIDEACGIFFGLFLLNIFAQLSIFNIIFYFVLFRIFDIFKPYPICAVEKFMKQRDNMIGIGIMFDDILAAVGAVFVQIVLLGMIS